MSRKYTENLCLCKLLGTVPQFLVPVLNNDYFVCVNQMISSRPKVSGLSSEVM